jgi:hypothetical protein
MAKERKQGLLGSIPPTLKTFPASLHGYKPGSKEPVWCCHCLRLLLLFLILLVSAESKQVKML